MEGASSVNDTGALPAVRLPTRPSSIGAGGPAAAAFCDALSKLPVAAYTCDLSGQITFFNHAAVELWGRTPRLQNPSDRFCGSLKLFAPNGTPIAHDRCWVAMALDGGGDFQGKEIIIERPDGSRAIALAHVTALRGNRGELLGVVNVVVDITEQKQIEAMLRRSEAESADFFDQAPMPLHWVAADGTLLRVNDAELALLGYARDEYEGHNIAEFHADQHVVADIMQRLQAGEELYNYEARMRCKDGTLKDVHINSNVRWEQGRFAHTRCFTRDVTDQKRAEQALREADLRKNAFLATLAHELRNPLAPIRNGVEILRRADGRTREARWALEIVDRQTAHLTRLVDDLLDLARITRDKLELRIQQVDLAGLVQAAVEVGRPLAEARRHVLVVIVSPEPMRLDGDPTRLEQVITNLLTNATKYSEPGAEIRVALARDGSEAVLTVHDTGIGIPSQMLTTVFDMFTQADQSLARVEGGLGIGLTLVKRIVELHGGSVSAASDGPGRGSTFTVRLPLVTA